MNSGVTTHRPTGSPLPPGLVSINVPAARRRFLDHCRIAKGLSANTLRAYEGDLADFVAYAGAKRTIAKVDRDVVREYARALLEGRRLKEATVRRRMATLKVLFRWLEREELVPLSVFHQLDLSIRLPRRLPRAIDEPDMRRLLQLAEADAERARGRRSYSPLLMHFAVVALFTTGLRISELTGARRDDVHVDEGAIQVRGKGNRERRVYLAGPQALAVLRRYLAARDRIPAMVDTLLLTSDGARVTASQVRKHLAAIASRAGITRRITPHMLRHTAATQLLEAGVDIRFVQRLLGHASIATTQLYTLVRDTSLRDRLNRANTLARLGRRGRADN